MRHDQEFSELFSARFRWASQTAYALCGNWKEAEEIAQNAFVRVYAQWPRIRLETAEAYLRTVVTRVFLDSKRRGRARESPVSDVPESAAHCDSSDFDERQALAQALQKVPHRQRAVLVLRFMHDLSVEQTADILKCSPGTVKSQTNRGLHTLRQAYGSAITTGGV